MYVFPSNVTHTASRALSEARRAVNATDRQIDRAMAEARRVVGASDREIDRAIAEARAAIDAAETAAVANQSIEELNKAAREQVVRELGLTSRQRKEFEPLYKAYREALDKAVNTPDAGTDEAAQRQGLKTKLSNIAATAQAAIMAKNNRTASQIVSEIEKLKPNVRASFVVDTLTYLFRGGRCNAVAAMAGGVLKLHPRIVVENGAMNASKKYRGKIDSVIMDYVKDMEKDLKNARPERVFITHSGCKQETVEKVRAYLEELGVFDEILETRAGGVISSHCGPGTLGVLYIAKS